MRKIILLFALLLSAMNMMGQAYKFEIDKKKYSDSGKEYFLCHSNLAELEPYSPDVSIDVYDDINKEKGGVVSFRLIKIGENSSNVISSILQLAKQIPDGAEGIVSKPTKLHLSNGDVLSGTERCGIELGKILSLFNNRDNAGVINVSANLLMLVSKYHPEQIQTFENQKVICQQLRTYDIVKIEVDGVSFDVRGLRSAATFDAMFNALAQKTGKGHDYRYNSSSSSSNVSSGPSASCKLDFVLTLENGRIICKMDDLIISGTRGKDYEVKAIFENTELDCIPHEFYLRKGISWDNGRDHWNVRIKGHVDDLDYMMWNNRGRFKVHIEITIDNQIVYESNSKYITFYSDGEKWRCVQHN